MSINKVHFQDRPNLIFRLGDYFFLLRPTLWFPVWTMILCGSAGNSWFGSQQQFVLSVLSLTILMGSVYLVNQLRDIEGDKLNNKLYFLASGIISERNAWIYFWALIISGFLLLVLSANYLLLLLVAGIMLITALLYNFGSKAMKNTPLGSVLSTFSGGLLLVLIGNALVDQPDIKWLTTLAYALSFLATGMMTMIPDVQGDKVAGKETIVVRFGPNITLGFSLALMLIAALIAWNTGEYVLLWPVCVTIPLLILNLFRRDTRYIIWAIKISILGLAISVGAYYYPVYLILIPAYFILARVYYRLRFNISYP